MLQRVQGLAPPTGAIRYLVALLLALSVVFPLRSLAADDPRDPESCFGDREFTLTVLHNNDGESGLLADGDVGGVDYFAGVVRALRLEAFRDNRRRTGRGVLLLSSGDNFLAGPIFSASIDRGIPYYDAVAMNAMRYDAICIGNHEFDFGPDVLADFIDSFRKPVGFLSANLDVSGEPRLAALENQGRITSSTIIRKGGRRIGIIGATTERLRFISSPRDVIVKEVRPAVQAEIDRLSSSGVNIVVFISHLQSIEEDQLLLPMLSGVDIAIAGGGDELLADDDDVLIPGDEANIYGSYPLWVTGADNVQVPVITTVGGYRYVGRLTALFDHDGNLLSIDDEKSGPVRVVHGDYPDAATPNWFIGKRVVEPVQAEVDALQQNIVATSQVTLDGLKSHLRTMETNEGNLVADALFWQAAQLAGDFGVPAPDIAIQNGGGVRNNSEIPPGDLSEFDTFSILPFPNFVTVIPDLPREQIKEIFENAVSRVEFADGRFAQVSGMSLVWDPNGTAQVLDADQNVVTPGTRVVRIELANGEIIVENGAVQAGPPVTVATIDFLATGGDEYPYRGAAYTKLGATYQQALRNYLVDGLGGIVTAALYPEGGEGRITTGTALNNLFAAPAAPEPDYAYALEQNHPNPFNPTTSIRFTLPAAGAYTLTVYDIAGRSVWKSNGSGSVGPNSVIWNGVDSRGSSVASGVYFYKLTSGTFSQTRKMTLMK